MVGRAAAAYFAAVFAVAFGLGVLRVLWLAPAIGPLVAVAIEVPLLLGLAWAVAGAVLRRWPLARVGRLAMGALAFGMLMAAEAGLALVSGQTLADFANAMSTPAGALGLAGQIGFAILPALRGQASG